MEKRRKTNLHRFKSWKLYLLYKLIETHMSEEEKYLSMTDPFASYIETSLNSQHTDVMVALLRNP